MKKVFVYYSLTGNGDRVSHEFKDNGYDVIKVVSKEPLPKIFFFKMLVGGFRATRGRKDKIEDIGNLSNYDKIVIGSPIWAGNFCSPMNSVLDMLDKNKELGFVFYSDSGKSDKASALVKSRFENAKMVTLQKPKDSEGEISKLKEIL